MPIKQLCSALLGRASLSGIQRKLLVVKDGKEYRPVRPNELSTHIAKLASGNLQNLIELEYLTTLAVRKLLPDDDIVDMEIADIAAIKEQALVVPRFDRTPTGKRLHHFEEFNQLLGRRSGDDKYEGGYEEMARFIRETPECVPAEIDRLFRRILSWSGWWAIRMHISKILLCFTCTRDGLRLTLARYMSVVAAAIYPESAISIALSVGGIQRFEHRFAATQAHFEAGRRIRIRGGSSNRRYSSTGQAPSRRAGCRGEV